MHGGCALEHLALGHEHNLVALFGGCVMVGSSICWRRISRVQERGKDGVVLIHVKVIGLGVLHTQHMLTQISLPSHAAPGDLRLDGLRHTL